jgi:hypothetical protein
MTARCKFQITNILPAYPNTDPATSDAKRVVFETRYDSTVEEDRAFTKYTPTGRLDVVIDNLKVTAELNVGDLVYVDITKL